MHKLLTSFASAFNAHDPSEVADRRATWLLALIIAAGAVIRFWDLGAVGLHGDEKTMSLPTLSIVEHGAPLMPSGMVYPRAVGQLYLMAAAVKVFGNTEWALRLPSALCGILLIGLTWLCGRRFLAPAWNLGLTAAVALLPDFIEDAQTARMYVFLVTSVAGYMALVFQWERTNQARWLVAAVLVLLVGLQFHTLAVFAAFMVLFPGLLRGDPRRFWLGMGAFFAIAGGFRAIDTWISRAYPQSVEADSGAVANAPHAAFIPHVYGVWLIAAGIAALALAWFTLAGRGRSINGARALAVALVAAGFAAAAGLSWHLAGLLILAGLVIARRDGPLPAGRVAGMWIVLAALAASQITYLYAHAAGSLRQIVGLMLGWPSVWPFVSLGQWSPVAAVLVAGAVAAGLWRLSRRESVPDFLLLVLLGVWLPLLMIGYMRWDIPPRYAEAQVMPLLVAAFASAQWGARRLLASGASEVSSRPPRNAIVAAAVGCVLVVNPLRVVHAVGGGYRTHPDHKGAAEFVESLHPGPHDIIIAEDVLQQTYYLGHVDYWLINKKVAAPFMHRVDGRWVDFYTNTPLIGTGEELRHLVEKADRGAIYVIGSGENFEDGRRLMRSFGIADALHSPPFRRVYQGRDGLTEVWKVDVPSQAAAAGRN
jgi:hypothetical protein